VETATYALNWATEQSSFEPTAWSDESARLVRASVRFGRDDVNGQFQPGTATLTLLNSDGRFSYGNASSGLYPDVDLMRAVQITATYGGNTYSVFYGYVTSIRPATSPNTAQHCTVTLVDGLGVISNILASLETGTKGAKTIDELITLMLAPDTVGDGVLSFEWPRMDISTTPSTTYTNVTYTNVPILATIQELAEHEGGLIYCGRDGYVTFRARTDRLTRAECITSQGTITAMLDLDAAAAITDVFNNITATYNAGASESVVENDASIRAYGLRAVGVSVPLITTAAPATALATWRLLRQYLPTLRPRIEMINSSSGLLTQILARDISHRVTITDLTGITGINGDFFIEGIEHEISDAGQVHRCAWQLSPISAWGGWALGVAGFSELGISTRLN
jgi:hypothetical protein